MFAAAAIVVFLALTAVGRADTISYADAVSALAKDCGPDIKKLCSGLNLGNGRIQQCLEKNASKVSPACTSTLATVRTSIATRQEAQAPVFKHDVSQYCNGVKGDGNIIFLVSSKPSTSTTRNATGNHRRGMALNDDRIKGANVRSPPSPPSDIGSAAVRASLQHSSSMTSNSWRP
jgi:hypothetical protein